MPRSKKLPTFFKGKDAQERSRDSLDTIKGVVESERETEEGEELPGRHPIALFEEDEQEENRAEKARQWARAEALAQAKVRREPWTLHVERGKVYLMRWRNRTGEVRANNPEAAPQDVVVGEEIGPRLPVRQKAGLQAILDQHAPGLRLKDLKEYRTRPGRRHPYRPSEWEVEAAEIEELRNLLTGLLPSGDEQAVQSLLHHPAAQRFMELDQKWKGARKCRRPPCPNRIPPRSRKVYCSTACQEAVKSAKNS